MNGKQIKDAAADRHEGLFGRYSSPRCRSSTNPVLNSASKFDVSKIAIVLGFEAARRLRAAFPPV